MSREVVSRLAAWFASRRALDACFVRLTRERDIALAGQRQALAETRRLVRRLDESRVQLHAARELNADLARNTGWGPTLRAIEQLDEP